MRWVSVSVAITAALSLAAPSPKATALAKDAERLYKDGQYLDAAKLLEEALSLEANPKLLYNMARAYDQAGELQRALDSYRRYVGLPSTDTEPDLVKKANLSMDRVRQLLARQEADARVRDAERDRLEKEAATAKARAEDEAQKAKAQKAAFDAKERARTEATTSTTSGKRVGAYVCGGVGVAGLTLGLILGLASNGSKQAFRDATLVSEKRARQADTIGQAIGADISLLVGLAGAVTALILFPFGDATAGLAPVPGGVMAALSLSL